MTRTLMALLAVAVTVGATTAHADDDWGRHRHRRHGHHARPVHHDCGPRPTVAPAGTTFASGQYQLQSTQRWVPGQPQQVWVPGTCRGRFHQRCTPGSYQWVTGPGHYETVQQWVWVPSGYAPQQYGSAGYGSDADYGYGYGSAPSATYSATYGDASGHAQVGVSFGYSTF